MRRKSCAATAGLYPCPTTKTGWRRQSSKCWDRFDVHRRFLLKFVFVFLAIAACARGADFAVLRNGFSISHRRRDVIGSITRLYTSADGKSYVDVSTDQI